MGTCVLLLNAGHEASVNGSGNGWWALFRHPDQLRRLRDDVNGLLGTAIEELLRIDTPLQMFERWVLEDIVVEGIDIRRGSEVALLFGSANHDPASSTRPSSSISAAGTTCTSRSGRDPLLPRRAARADGAGVHLRDTAPPDSALVARGGTALEAGYVIRGLESPGHDPVSSTPRYQRRTRHDGGTRSLRCSRWPIRFGGAVVGTTLGATLHDAPRPSRRVRRRRWRSMMVTCAACTAVVASQVLSATSGRHQAGRADRAHRRPRDEREAERRRVATVRGDHCSGDRCPSGALRASRRCHRVDVVRRRPSAVSSCHCLPGWRWSSWAASLPLVLGVVVARTPARRRNDRASLAGGQRGGSGTPTHWTSQPKSPSPPRRTSSAASDVRVSAQVKRIALRQVAPDFRR